jgi:hypothetical protein
LTVVRTNQDQKSQAHGLGDVACVLKASGGKISERGKKKWSLFYIHYQIYNRNSARRNIKTLYSAALGQTALNVSKIHINKL